MLYVRPLVVLGLTGFAVLGALGPRDAGAQQIYRSVGSDGRVTFSDQPPLDASGQGTVAPVVALPAPAAPEIAALPFEVRQAATRYPVTLYAGPQCAPCVTARSMLAARGIPFTEKTVASAEDIEALKRLASVATLPVLMIGGEQLKGYTEREWALLLDAAGYPKTSQLPPGYRQAPATPLVALQEVKPPARARPPAPVAATPPSPPPPPANGGIRF